MSCPRCGDVCHCDSEFRSPGLSAAPRRPRFEADDDGSGGSTMLVDPDAYDASEEQFSASLERKTARPKFVLDVPSEPLDRMATGVSPAQPEHGIDPPQAHCAPSEANMAASTAPAISESILPEATSAASAACAEMSSARADVHISSDPTFWKDEVAARLNSYRARRKPRPPKFPSLRLKFETPEPRTRFYPPVDEPPAAAPRSEPPAAPIRDTRAVAPAILPVAEPEPAPPQETGRVIEFPRFWTEPPATDYDLAEPIMDRPRIVEVPEIAPPPPALGGIILPTEEKEPERRPGFEIPLQSAPMGRRVAAMAIDGMFVLAACGLFGYIVFKMAGTPPMSMQGLETAVAVLAIIWSGYQYLSLTYTGSTPGLRVARLRLSQFDGSPVARRMRRWRVLASILSAVSLGLGFAWSYLDEDALCWHDRITHTYLAPTK